MTSAQNKVAMPAYVFITANYHYSIHNFRFDILLNGSPIKKKKERELERE